MLNSVEMFQGRFDSTLFEGMRVVTALGSVFGFFVTTVFTFAFGGTTGDVFELFLSIPSMLIDKPLFAFVYFSRHQFGDFRFELLPACAALSVST